MRPIVSGQNHLRFPVNEILGTHAHVRLLRVMAMEVDGPLTVSDAAKRAGLTVPGAQKALGRLLDSGFVSRIGGGRKLQYEIRRSSRLMTIVVELFQAEKDRYDQLLTGIKKEIENLIPHPFAAWIRAFPEEMGAPLSLGLLHETLHLTDSMQQLRTRLNRIEKEFDLTIEVEGYTKADISDVSFERVIPLYGALPLQAGPLRQEKKTPDSHEDRDASLKDLSHRLAKALEQDTSLLKRAREHVDRLLGEDQGTASRDLMEWRDILNLYTIQRLSRFLTSSSQRADRLRQSNPLFAVLSKEEQARMVAGKKNKNDPRST